VVSLPRLREVLFRVIDDMVCPDRSDHVHVARTTDASHLCSERFGNLHREGSDASRGPVDQYPLPGLDLAVIANREEGDGPGHGNGRGLLEREPGRLVSPRVFGKCAHQMPAPAEDLVTRTKPRHACADGLDFPRYVCASNPILWRAQTV